MPLNLIKGWDVQTIDAPRGSYTEEILYTIERERGKSYFIKSLQYYYRIRRSVKHRITRRTLRQRDDTMREAERLSRQGVRTTQEVHIRLESQVESWVGKRVICCEEIKEKISTIITKALQIEINNVEAVRDKAKARGRWEREKAGRWNPSRTWGSGWEDRIMKIFLNRQKRIE